MGFLLEPKYIIENESSNLLPNKSHPRGKTRHAKKEIKTRKKIALSSHPKKKQCDIHMSETLQAGMFNLEQ